MVVAHEYFQGWIGQNTLEVSGVVTTDVQELALDAQDVPVPAATTEVIEGQSLGARMHVFVAEYGGVGGQFTFEVQESLDNSTFFTTYTIANINFQDYFRVYPLFTPYVRLKLTENGGVFDADYRLCARIFPGGFAKTT